MASLFALILGLGVLPALSTQAASDLPTRLAGRIVLAIEERGEAWYIDPLTERRTYLGRPEDALVLMRRFGLGITNADLAQIPTVDSQAQGDTTLRQRLRGRILLQVQEHGEAWYVDPVSSRRVYLGRPEDAFAVMQRYGLGITSYDLMQIPLRTLSAMKSIRQSVPFTSQAPRGEWSDPRQQDGCEEASVLMAVFWARQEELTTSVAEREIIAMSDWEKDRFGSYIDTGIQDTADRLLAGYFNIQNYRIYPQANSSQLIEALDSGAIALLPINGQVFEPFHYTPPGPERHMVVVHGYEEATDSFLVHDPGTSVGNNLTVTRAVLERSWRDYASGDHVPIPDLPQAFIAITR